MFDRNLSGFNPRHPSTEVRFAKDVLPDGSLLPPVATALSVTRQGLQPEQQNLSE
jgi:hypothetical protein